MGLRCRVFRQNGAQANSGALFLAYVFMRATVSYEAELNDFVVLPRSSR